jgi:hypothetical protein
MEASAEQVKGRIMVSCPELSLLKAFDPSAQSALALRGQIYDTALMYPVPAVSPAERYVHRNIQSPERLSTFWRTPDHDQSFSRY